MFFSTTFQYYPIIRSLSLVLGQHLNNLSTIYNSSKTIITTTIIIIIIIIIITTSTKNNYFY